MSADPRVRLQRALDLLLGRRRTRSATTNRELARARRDNHAWLTHAGVTGIGVAPRLTNGAQTGELAVCVRVRAKGDVACEAPAWIPPTLRLPGIAGVVLLDVVECAPLQLQLAHCGDAISEAGRVSWGTLGCLVEAGGTLAGKLLMLTCSHVLPGPKGTLIEWLGFPGRDDASRLALGSLAERSTLRPAIASERYPNLYEVSLTTVAQLTVDDDLRDIGPPSALRMAPVAVGEVLRLCGAKSGLREGRVTAVGQNHMLPIGGIEYGFQGLILHDALTRDGDSGAAVVDAQNRVVGLHMGRVDGAAVMMPIGPIVRRYGLRLPTFPDSAALADAGLVPSNDRALAIDVLARTIWGEARGESGQGREAVANVVINRARRRRKQFGLSVEDVCRKPWQFSCWNPNDPNRNKLERVTLNDPVFPACLYIARRAMSGNLPDRTQDSTHYHLDNIAPNWSQGHAPAVRIGRHWFYNDVR